MDVIIVAQANPEPIIQVDKNNLLRGIVGLIRELKLESDIIRILSRP